MTENKSLLLGLVDGYVGERMLQDKTFKFDKRNGYQLEKKNIQQSPTNKLMKPTDTNLNAQVNQGSVFSSSKK
jgi:hypothetical protein